MPTPRSTGWIAPLGLLGALALAGCPSPGPTGPGGNGRGGPVEEGLDEAPPPPATLLAVERGLVLWFRAQRAGVPGGPRLVALFAARDERGALQFESLGLGSTSLRLVAEGGGLWLFPVGGKGARGAAEVYHPERAPGRAVPLGEGLVARKVSQEQDGTELTLWFVPRDGLRRLELRQGGELQLTLERDSRARWGSRPARYPAEDPAAAWDSRERALRALDVVGLRELLTPELWARLLPPGEGLAVPAPELDQERRLFLMREVLPRLLEVELEPSGPYAVQADRASAPARLRVWNDSGAVEVGRATLLFASEVDPEGPRWRWAGFRREPD